MLLAFSVRRALSASGKLRGNSVNACSNALASGSAGGATAGLFWRAPGADFCCAGAPLRPAFRRAVFLACPTGHTARRRRIILHPALPIGVEESAEFLRCGGLRARIWLLLRIVGCAENNQWRSNRRAGDCDRERCEQTNYHGFLPAAVASSFSRSRASITMRRAVSAASMAVLSTRTG